MRYCGQCIQFGNDVDNPVKHDPTDCPEYGSENRLDHIEQWSRDNPPQDFGEFENLTIERRESAFNRLGINLTEAQQSKIKSATHLTWSTGTIRRYFPDKAYGFIRPDDNGLDVWVHKKFCAEGYTPVEGDKVVYLTRLGDGGSLVAKEVDLISNKYGIDLGHKSGDRSIFNQPVIQNTLGIVEGAEPKEIPWESGGTLIHGNPAESFIDPVDYSTTPQDTLKLYEALYGKRS